MLSLIRLGFRFRELIGALAARELRGRYRGSALGKAWLLLQPLAFLGIYMAVFGHLFRSSEVFKDAPATLFALAMFAGLIPWLAFSEAINGGSNVILQGGSLIKKYAFPSEILPITVTLVSLFSTLVGFAMLAAVAFPLLGHGPRLLWMFPLVVALQGIFTLGLVYLLSSVVVYIRDLGQMIPMLTTFWFFMSPIFMFAKVPGSPDLLRTILRYNPMTYLISLYREIFIWTPELLQSVNGPTLDERRSAVALPYTDPGAVPWHELSIFAACAFAMLLLGLFVFRKLKAGFADEV